MSDWKKCFDGYDRDRSGSIDFNELKAALAQFGYRVSDQFVQFLIYKHDPHRRGVILFDDFIQINFQIQKTTEAFQRADTDRDGWVQLNYEQLLTMMLEIAT